MPDQTKPSDLTWTPNPDGDYNAVATDYKGQQIEVSSDRDGTDWGYTINDGVYHSGYSTKELAMKDAIEDVEDDDFDEDDDDLDDDEDLDDDMEDNDE
jgi:cobalamin biosynthesis protein CobT